jgi:hypothetical protein
MADEALLFRRMRSFEGRAHSRGMACRARFVRCYDPVKIVIRNQRDFLAGGKIEKKEKDRGGNDDKENVLIHNATSG